MHSLTCGKNQMKTRQFTILTCLQLRVNSRFSSAVYLNMPWCQKEKLHYLPMDFASCQLLHWRKDLSIQKVRLCCQKNLHFCTETGNISCSDHSASFASTKASKPQAGWRGRGGNISAPTELHDLNCQSPAGLRRQIANIFCYLAGKPHLSWQGIHNLRAMFTLVWNSHFLSLSSCSSLRLFNQKVT